MKWINVSALHSFLVVDDNYSGSVVRSPRGSWVTFYFDGNRDRETWPRYQRRCHAKRAVELLVLGGGSRDPDFEHPRKVQPDLAHKIRNDYRRARCHGGRCAVRDLQAIYGYHCSTFWRICATHDQVRRAQG